MMGVSVPLFLVSRQCHVSLCLVASTDSELFHLPLTTRYECDIACTPLIVSDSFVKSQKARDVDFTTHPGEA